MPYALLEVELTEPLPTLRLGDEDTGVAIVSRRHGCVVGFAMHEAPSGTRLDPVRVEELLDPSPIQPPVIGESETAGAAATVTVAVCTRGRPDLLRACLGALLQLDPAPDEILIVDNAPPDGQTRELVEELGLQYQYQVEPCPGLDFARNRALRTATCEVVAFVDDDVVVDRHWLSSLRDVWRQHPDAGAVTGQILPLELATDAQVAFERRGGFRGGNEQIRYAGLHLDGNPTYPYGAGMFGAGANMSVRRRTAMRLGGFDEALDTGPPLPGGGDIDMLHRVIRAGFPLVYEPRSVVFHRHRRDAAGLRRQYDSWGRSLMAYAVKTYRRDPEGRPKLRRLIRWFFATHLREARGAAMGDGVDRDAARAELWGGLAGLLGTYGRSQRRSRRRRWAKGNPVVCILPWGHLVEDYLDPIGLTLDDYVERLSGGWLFGYAEALHAAGVDTVIACWSRTVDRPTRRFHVPTGATVLILPPSPAYMVARARLADPYAWGWRAALGEGSGSRILGSIARLAAPYLTASPLSLAAVLRGESCRAVLSQEYEEGRFDVAVALGRLLRIPVFATFQGGDHTRTQLERWVRPHTVRSSAGLVIAAEPEVERVRKAYRLPSDRIERIPNPLDPASVILRSRSEARAALGIAPEARVAMWHGRVDIHPKGIDTLIDAWREVRATCATPPTLLLLGTGSGADWLQDRILRHGLTDVLWRNEYVLDRKVIGTYLSAADVFVLPSRQEGFPVAPVEAMAAGLAVIATDAPGVQAVVGVGDDAGGVIVPCDDPHSLARELRRFLDDDTLAVATGARAQRRATEQFSLDAVGARLRRFLVDR